MENSFQDIQLKRNMGKELFFSKILSFLRLVLNGHCGRNLFFFSWWNNRLLFPQNKLCKPSKKTFLMEDREREEGRERTYSLSKQNNHTNKNHGFYSMKKVKWASNMSFLFQKHLSHFYIERQYQTATRQRYQRQHEDQKASTSWHPCPTVPQA